MVSSTPGNCCPLGFERVGASHVANASLTWDGDFNSGAGGDYVALCTGRNGSSNPITALTAFVTPSHADPFMGCPAGWSKVTAALNTSCTCRGQSPNHTDDCWNCEDLNSGSANLGAMYLCAQRDAAVTPIMGLEAVAGNDTACPSSSTAVPAAEGMAPGPWDFDPKGEKLQLCVSVNQSQSREQMRAR